MIFVFFFQFMVCSRSFDPKVEHNETTHNAFHSTQHFINGSAIICSFLLLSALFLALVPPHTSHLYHFAPVYN